MLLTVGEAVLYVEEQAGDGPPIVFVHGSWDDHRTWDACRAQLAGRRTVAFDRRGHSASTAPDRQGSITDDVDDLAAVLDWVAAPATLVGHSYGATVALLATLDHPALVLGAVVHEPPLFAVLRSHPEHGGLLESVGASMSEAARLIEVGEAAAGARRFVEEVGFGSGTWTTTFDQHHREVMVANAQTWLDQYRDPNRLALAPERLATAERPILVTRGTASPPIYGPSLDLVLAAAAGLASTFIDGAGHAAPLTHPRELARVILDFVDQIGA